MPSTLEISKAKSGDTRQHIIDLIAKLEPQMRRSFLLGVNRIKQSISLKEVERLLEQGQVEAALGLLTSVLSKLGDDFIAFVVLSGGTTAALLEEVLDITISFDQTNFRAVEMMRRNRLRLIQQFTDEQRRATRQALIAGITEGLNPRAQALAFRDSIGLTARQERAVQNYRRLLKEGSAEALTRALRDRRFDGTVNRAISEGQALTKDQIDRMVERYRERYLKYRSEVIARTEALRAAHQGTEEMFRQAIESGNLDSDKLSRTWLTARDERVRHSHSLMNGQKRAVGVPFRSGHGYELMYPGDPNAPASETVQCRCIVTTRFKE